MISKLAHFLLRILGWRIVGGRPPFKKYVLVGAPHTSNWDFLYFYLAALALEMKISFLAKDSLFRGPLGIALRRMGGIPVIRSRSTNMVDQMVEIFSNREELILLIPPSGTRKRTEYWKSGFYFIALGAHVPLALAIMDFARNEVGIVHWFMPTGNIKRDVDILRGIYSSVEAKFPAMKSAIRLRQEEQNVADEEMPKESENKSELDQLVNI